MDVDQKNKLLLGNFEKGDVFIEEVLLKSERKILFGILVTLKGSENMIYNLGLGTRKVQYRSSGMS